MYLFFQLAGTDEANAELPKEDPPAATGTQQPTPKEQTSLSTGEEQPTQQKDSPKGDRSVMSFD